MAVVNHNYTCDLREAVNVHHICKTVLDSTNTNNIVVTILDNGTAASVSGTIGAKIIRPDGSTVTATGSLSGNVVTVSLPSSAYSVHGLISITVQITASGVVTTIAAVVACV